VVIGIWDLPITGLVSMLKNHSTLRSLAFVMAANNDVEFFHNTATTYLVRFKLIIVLDDSWRKAARVAVEVNKRNKLVSQ
jgi:hypothetical protein